ncbi:MAG: asparagine synthase (glutamine-hydrolyzing) [Micrococcales bacterium]|nr:asparagine synthase (glutamine-hydrolyzing) [Micrococcales bacterium]
MCGLFGLIAESTLSITQQNQLINAISFRGPDEQALLDLTPAGGPLLGHTRLSIIGDDSAAQPMWSRNGRFCLTFNGEIYNFEKLSEEFGIDSAGSDTRLLVELWSQIGAHAIALLRGQWAFAVWDTEVKECYLVTDEFGILPLYLHIQADSVCWASSARVFKAAKLNLAPDRDSINEYLRLRYAVSPNTFFENVTKLKPGSLVTISTDRQVSIHNWNQPGLVFPSARPPKSLDLAREIQKSVESSLRSDQEVGIFLSGGVDSALIASIASSKSVKPVKAYTAFWLREDLDSELENARETCRALNVEITPVVVTAESWWKALIAGAEFRESPAAEIADPVVYLLSERARKDVKVVLSGEGADELFFGYPKYAVEALIAKPTTKAIVTLALQVISKVKPQSTRLARLRFAIQDKSKLQRWDDYFSNLPTIGSTQSQSPLNSEVSDVRGMQLHDLEGYLPNALLERADRNGMAHALEVRPSMLSAELKKQSLSLNPKAQTRLLSTKIGYRKAAKLLVGRKIAFRKSRGFPIPLSSWIKTELAEKFRSTLSSRSVLLDEIVPIDNRSLVLDEHISGKRDHSLLLFTWVSLIIWETEWT